MTELQCTIEQRVEHINMLTKAVKQSFFEIALQMKAIKDDGGFKNNKAYLQFMLEQTGYKSNMVYAFLRSHEAMGNLEDFAQLRKLPTHESQIRPLATKKLNEDPELQAEIWTTVVEAAGDGEITAKMVKDAVKAKVNPDPPASKKDAPTELFSAVEQKIAADFIKLAYRKLSQECHPDHEGGSNEKMQALNKIKTYFQKLMIDPLQEEI